MKTIVLSLALLVSISASAGSVYRCKDENGRTSFSNRPCANSAPSYQPAKPRTQTASQKHQPAGNSSQTAAIRNQADLTRHLDALSINKLSQFVDGIGKDSFFGIDLHQLLEIDGLSYDTYLTDTDKLLFLVMTEDNFKMFSAMYGLEVEGRNESPYLDLSNDAIFRKMRAKGFGKPRISGLDEEFEWTWNSGKYECSALYRRSFQNPGKLFQYTCEQRT